MKAIYTHKAPHRDDKHKFIPGQTYDLDKATLDRFPGRFEIVTEPKKPKDKDVI